MTLRKWPYESYQNRGPIQDGDCVTVLSLCAADDVDDLYGVLVDIQHEQGRFMFPLCDLEVTDPSDPWAQSVDDYAVWFANR